MKKKIIITIVAAILLIAGTFTGTVLAENNGLIDGIKSKMKTNIESNTDAKIEAASAAIQSSIETALSDVLTYQSGRVNTEINKYINDKIQNISASESMNDISQDIVLYATQLIAEEKARVDQIIEDMLN